MRSFEYRAPFKLSKPGKMPCPSWSLQAIETCPASRGADGELVPACRGCYATAGNYRFPNVKAPREFNRDSWQRDDWEDAMVAAIDGLPYFRWFDSGDVYHRELAEKIYRVMARTPGTRHWLPTRMHKLRKFRPVLQRMNRLKNVVIRYSGDGIHGEVIRGRTVSTIFDADNAAPPEGAHVCPAYTTGGQCGDCRACWDRDVRVIAYPQHGRKMSKVNSDLIARAA